MIARKIKSPKNVDSYRFAAYYIEAAKEEGEKLHSLWLEGFNAGTEHEDLELAILEAESTQKLNPHARKEKMYHLVISFRHDDKIPDAEGLKHIERQMAKALGFEEHQRVVGCHSNTDHFHIHVAYNRVHPKTFKLHKPYKEYYRLMDACKKMEIKYGLQTAFGKQREQEQSKDKKRVNQAAKDKEAHTWEESFESYVKRHKEDIKNDLANAKDWASFHDKMEKYNITFKPRGAGLIIQDMEGKHRIKASALGREFSMKSLESKLGPYQAYEIDKIDKIDKAVTRPVGKDRYKPRPITKHPSTDKYWKRYMGIKKKDMQKAGLASSTFKEFLMYQVLEINDPLAMAIIHYHKKMITLVEKTIAPSRKKQKPNALGL